jgi:hypothetical protein
MDQPIVDKKDQYEKLEETALPGEIIEAVFDLKGGGTWFVGITNRRVVIYDRAFLRRMKAVVSIPYSRISTIAAEDQSGLLTGRGFFGSSKLHLTTVHGTHELEFRGSDKAHLAHNLILGHMVEHD